LTPIGIGWMELMAVVVVVFGGLMAAWID